MNPTDPTEQIIANALKVAIENKSAPETIEALQKALEDKQQGTPSRWRWPTFGEIFLLTLSILFIGFALLTFISDQRLAWTGIHTQGTVIDMHITRYQKGGDTYSPVIEFASGDGTTHQFTGLGDHYPPRYGVKQQVNIVYDPANPSVAQIEGADTSLLAVIGVFGLISLIVALHFIRARNRKLAR